MKHIHPSLRQIPYFFLDCVKLNFFVPRNYNSLFVLPYFTNLKKMEENFLCVREKDGSINPDDIGVSIEIKMTNKERANRILDLIVDCVRLNSNNQYPLMIPSSLLEGYTNDQIQNGIKMFLRIYNCGERYQFVIYGEDYVNKGFHVDVTLIK